MRNLGKHDRKSIKGLVGFLLVAFTLQAVVSSLILAPLFLKFTAYADIAESPVLIDLTGLAKKEKEAPVRIIIPKIAVDLEVKPSVIVDGAWKIYEDSAGFGSSTGYLNDESGNTVVFAHAKEGLFAKAKELKKDDLIYMFSEEGWYRYKVYDVISVKPESIGALNLDLGKGLVLITCEAPDDLNRILVYGVLDEIKTEER